MGCGDFPCGIGPAGFDPVADPSNRIIPARPRAPMFDLATRGFPLDSNGHVLGVHPVDQKVSIALGIAQGKLAPATNTGNKLQQIKFASGPRLAETVRDVVTQSLASLIAAKDITLLSIDLDTSVRGRIVLAVNYMNNHLAVPNNRKTVQKDL